MSTARAITGAYLLVAFADHDYDADEEARFLDRVANHPDLEFVETRMIATAYNTLNSALRQDFVVASEEIRAVITRLKDDDQVRRAVITAARTAVVADKKMLPQEEAAIAQIEAALGLEPGTV